MDEYNYLLDLDGTLVNTDHIYLKVWSKILKEYGINCDIDFFNHFIKGKSDNMFLKYFNLHNKDFNESISKISKLKDKYFLEFIENEENILYDGVLDFLEKIKDANIAIVTSSNKIAAQAIIKKYNIEKYIKCLIASEDVNNHKPDKEPYMKAAEILNVSLDKCIIFEDSYSGLLSAINANPYKIYVHNINNINILNSKCYYFDNYNNLNINNDIIYNCDMINNIKNALEYLPLKDISQCNQSNIKPGYICDIKKYTLTYFDDEIQNIIVKISNNDNELSKVAEKLDMYNNEIYFYNNLSNIINVNLPKYFASFENNEKKSFIMEDLTKYNGQFNMNLNNNITLLLSVINNVFKMHNKFYFESRRAIINNMKKLKKINDIKYYKDLINDRFDIFINKNKKILSNEEINILTNIYNNFDNILNKSSQFPLSFCHGDLKSPNIFYKNNEEPYFLDWQYIHLNKGISDIVFLLVESLDFNSNTSDLCLKYYYSLLKENKNIPYENFIEDFKNSLCIFPFFVMVWFNSEDPDKLIDKLFPIKFMRNVLEYYKYYL